MLIVLVGWIVVTCLFPPLLALKLLIYHIRDNGFTPSFYFFIFPSHVIYFFLLFCDLSSISSSSVHTLALFSKVNSWLLQTALLYACLDMLILLYLFEELNLLHMANGW